MIKFLKSIFFSEPAEKLLKERDRLYKRAVAFQRNGDLRSYAEVITKISELEEEYAQLMAEKED